MNEVSKCFTGCPRKIDTDKLALFYNIGRIEVKKSMAENKPNNFNDTHDVKVFG